MVANNNLSSYASADIVEMTQGMTGLSESDAPGRWLVYFSGPDLNPRLIEIDRQGRRNTLKTYDSGTLSVSVSRMRQVLTDVRALAPADSYGLVLWSHASGWLNESSVLPPGATTASVAPQSFGADGLDTNPPRMALTSLAQALDGFSFNYIYFDCCHMGTVEVLYQLRRATSRIIASPTEMGVNGMPYHRNVSPLLNSQLSLALDNTFQFYNERFGKGGTDSYGCSIALYDLSALPDLASATKALMSQADPLPDSYVPLRCFRPSVVPGGNIYDMAHYVRALAPSTSPLLTDFNSALSRLITFHAATTTVYGLEATRFCGLGSNIIRSRADAEHGDYTGLQWWTDVVANLNF